MKPLFTEEQCQSWKKQDRNTNCCKNPDFIQFLKQDRAIDEMPNSYRQCKNCLRVIRNRKC